MRLNKKKLAAVAMSAVMAASTMPFSVWAEEADGFVSEEYVEAAEEVVETPVADDAGTVETQSAYTITAKSWDLKTGKLTLTLTNKETGKTVSDEYNGTKSLVSAATCVKAATYQWQASTYWETVKSDVFDEGEPLGHTWVENVFKEEQAPTCETEGKGYKATICSSCNEIKDGIKVPVVTEKTAHTFGETYLVYTNLVNIKVKEKADGTLELDKRGHVQPILDTNGNVQLDNSLLPGSYTVQTYHQCSKCNTEVATDTAKDVNLTQTGGYEDLAIVKEVHGVVDEDAKGLINKTLAQMEKVDLNALELVDCDVAGDYVVYYYGTDGHTLLKTKTYEIPAHHVKNYAEPVFKSETDKNNCTVTGSTAKGWKVVNNTCNKDITYTQKVTCDAAGCKLRGKVVSNEEVTVKPTGDHTVDKATRTAVQTIMAKKNTSGYMTAAAYEELEEYVKNHSKLVKLASTATCEKEGVATITYLCEVCGKDASITDSVKVVALGHKASNPVEVDRVEPTCTSLGSYDSVVYCARCSKELSRIKNVKIPRLKHTNEVSVGTNGVGVDDKKTDTKAYIIFSGTKVIDTDGSLQDRIGNTLKDDQITARAVTNCDTCQKHIVTLEKGEPENVNVTILSVKPENKVGGVGAITLSASFRKSNGEILKEQITVPYFSSRDAYLKYFDDIKPTVDGLYKDADGVYRYYVDGEVATSFNGIVEYEGGEFFVAKGVLCSTANGLNEYGGKWYFLSQGQIQRGYNGLAEYDGQWFYLTNGELTTTINGLVNYDGGQFVFAEGRLVKEGNGLWQDPSDKTWYFLSQGQVQTQHTGVAMYDGEFFVVRAGKLASDYNGTIEYDGAKFNVVAGQLYDKVA